nr:hypothetical protein CFP56_54280 [Quercus suber]
MFKYPDVYISSLGGGARSLGIKQHQSHISGVTYFYKLRCMWDYIQEMRMLELLLDARFWISFGSHLKGARPSVMKKGLIRVY